MPDATALDSIFARERPRLVGLGYRLTGSLTEAEDLVQEAFVRALERPPSDVSLPLRPWLVRVVVNLGRDRLRARRRRAYVGPWLPEALEHPDDAVDRRDGEARYGELESVTLAFLSALEALSPTQRAVLLLRDVLDLSVRETAEVLGRNETYVKVAHHRARGRMEGYDASRLPPDEATRARTRAALERFVVALVAHDVDALTALLREDCVTTNDGGGEFHAARRPIVGRDKTLLFHRKILRDGVPFAHRIATINGLPTLVARFGASAPHLAEVFCFQVECDEAGAIRAIRSTLAGSKLGHIVFPELEAASAERVDGLREPGRR